MNIGACVPLVSRSDSTGRKRCAHVLEKEAARCDVMLHTADTELGQYSILDATIVAPDDISALLQAAAERPGGQAAKEPGARHALRVDRQGEGGLQAALSRKRQQAGEFGNLVLRALSTDQGGSNRLAGCRVDRAPADHNGGHGSGACEATSLSHCAHIHICPSDCSVARNAIVKAPCPVTAFDDRVCVLEDLFP